MEPIAARKRGMKEKGVSPAIIAVVAVVVVVAVIVVGFSISQQRSSPSGGGGGTTPLEVLASANSTSGAVPLTVNFSVLASGGSPPYTYSWYFDDDGSTSSQQNPTHTFYYAGTYSAEVHVTDSTAYNLNSDTVIVNVTS
jgi:PKD repeat protein